MSCHFGVLGPFRFESDLPLPELRDNDAPGLLPVSVRLEPAPRILPAGVIVDRFCTVAPGEYLLHIPGVARFYAANGCEVSVEPEGTPPPADLRIYLLGSIFGALCHQNGFLPLHASAVASGGAVTAFLGPSGAGKSTLVAALAQRGYTVVSDDICLLDPGSGDGTRVIPVAGWMKLWRQSLEHLGQTHQEEHRVFSTEDKFRVFLGPPPGTTAHLANIVFLERPDSSHSAAVAELLPLTPAAVAVAALMDNTYLAYLPHATGAQRELFSRCAALLGRVKTFRLLAPLGWDRLDQTLQLVEDTLLQPSSP